MRTILFIPSERRLLGIASANCGEFEGFSEGGKVCLIHDGSSRNRKSSCRKETSMKSIWNAARCVMVMTAVVICFGCAEGKIGVGPFKAASVEVGPGGPEAKGPSAGPVTAGSAEVGPEGHETKGPSAGPFETKDMKAKSQPKNGK